MKLAARLAAAGLGAIAVELAYAILRPTPRVVEFDPSGRVGPTGGKHLSMVVLGDSSGTGPGVGGHHEIWSHRVARRLANDGFLVDLYSLAASGATSAEVLAEQVPAAEKLRPDLAFVSVGANDVLHQVPLRRFEANLDRITGRLRSVAPVLILTGVGDLGTIPRLLPPLRQFISHRARTADAIARRVAERHGITKAELWGEVAVAFRDRAIFSDDLFHPKGAGHAIWADMAWAALSPMIGKLDSDGAG
ncbi:MAG: SGNH/GDSL hydrolase family protein [Actinomycetota bacterium]